MSRTYVYVGTSERPIPPFPDGNNEPGEGVAAFELSQEGSLIPLGIARTQSPSVLCASADGQMLYAANETRNFYEGLPGSGGGVTFFAVAEDGSLVEEGSGISYGAAPAYLDVSPSGRWLVVANHGSHSQVACGYAPDGQGGWRLERKYDDTSLAVFEVDEDGAVGTIRDLRVFEGGGGIGAMDAASQPLTCTACALVPTASCTPVTEGRIASKCLRSTRGRAGFPRSSGCRSRQALRRVILPSIRNFPWPTR